MKGKIVFAFDDNKNTIEITDFYTLDDNYKTCCSYKYRFSIDDYRDVYSELFAFKRAIEDKMESVKIPVKENEVPCDNPKSKGKDEIENIEISIDLKPILEELKGKYDNMPSPNEDEDSKEVDANLQAMKDNIDRLNRMNDLIEKFNTLNKVINKF